MYVLVFINSLIHKPVFNAILIILSSYHSQPAKWNTEMKKASYSVLYLVEFYHKTPSTFLQIIVFYSLSLHLLFNSDLYLQSLAWKWHCLAFKPKVNAQLKILLVDPSSRYQIHVIKFYNSLRLIVIINVR